jgi:hypothetical protein
MPRSATPGDAARPDAAELNRRIRLFTRGRLWWSREALAELAAMQAAYLEAQRDEERLGRGDVDAVA